MEPKERVHYAPKRIDELEPREMDYLKCIAGYPFFKPAGLWYSAPCDGDGWEHWCDSEDFPLGVYRHQVDVDLSRMAVLRSGSDIDDFNARYSIGKRGIDWLRVFDDFAGIECAPYCYSRRLDHRMLWYYGWDCASGCVWDLSAVTRWEALPE